MNFRDFITQEGILDLFKKPPPRRPSAWGGPKPLPYGGSASKSYGSKGRSKRVSDKWNKIKRGEL